MGEPGAGTNDGSVTDHGAATDHGAVTDHGAADPPQSPAGGSWLAPGAVVQRIDLGDGSWVDVGRGWMRDADTVHRRLLDGVRWQSSALFRYEQSVEENRLSAGWRRGQPMPHAALAEATRALQRRYGVEFPGFGMLLYRDGRDGQAFHRDTDMRWLDDTVVAILTFGATRSWLLRPRTARHSLAAGKGATHDLSPVSGDLLVMGGRCQADWEHSVPYLRTAGLEARISVQWRAARRTGRPFPGPSYRAPLTYGRR